MAEVVIGIRDRGGRVGTGTAALVALDAALTVAERVDLDLAAELPARRIYHATPSPAQVTRAAAAATAAARAGLSRLLKRLEGHRAVSVAVPIGIPGPEVLDLPLAHVLAKHTLIHAAEAELYRDALAIAATDLDLPVTRYPVRGVANAAASALRLPTDKLTGKLAELGRLVGRPWRAEHAHAAAAALLSASADSGRYPPDNGAP